VATIPVHLPLYLLVVPLSWTFEVTGGWKRLVRGRGAVFGAFDDYRAKAGDVFACAGFKSGTTWLLQIATQIAHRGAAEFADIHHVVPWPDCPPTHKASPGAARRPVATRPLAHGQARDQDRTCRFDAVPYSAEAFYIGLVRDPKDRVRLELSLSCVRCCSAPRAVGRGLGRDVRAARLRAGGLGGAFAELLAEWRDRPNVLFLTYEELKRDCAAGIRRIAGFWAWSSPQRSSRRWSAARASRNMKQEQHRFNPGHVVPWGSAGGYMIRRGERGGSGELTREQRRIMYPPALPPRHDVARD